MEAIAYLTGISLLLIIGIFGSILAKRLRVSRILILVLTGILLANTGFKAFGVFTFPAEFMVGLSLLTLAMIVFDGSSRFTLHEVEKGSERALELVIIFIVMNALLVGGATILLFYDWNVQSILHALIFAVVMAGTDPGSVFIMLGETKHKVLDFLKLEAVLNTPLVVIIPFLLLDLIENVSHLSVADTFTSLLAPFLQQVFVGVGAGMMIGIVVFKLMKKWYNQLLSPVVTITAAVLTYVVAENLSGNGVLAVATLGLLFGNTYVRRKGQLMEFSSLLALILQILVFLLIGLLVTLDFTLTFFLKSLTLFLVAVIARYASILIALHGSAFKPREKVFMALNMPKGIAVAVVTLTFFALDATGMNGLLTLMILFVVYSLLLSSVTDRFGKFFIRKEIVAEETTPKPAPMTTPGKSAAKAATKKSSKK